MAIKAVAEKQQMVADIQDEVNQSEIVVLLNYKGLSVAAMSELRNLLRQVDGRLSVQKNTLMMRAFDGLKIGYPQSFFEGPTAVITTRGDLVKAARVVCSFAKDNEQIQIKGGVLQASSVTAADVNNISKLPGKDELIAMVVGLMKLPLTKLVLTVQNPIRSFIYGVRAIHEKKGEVNE